MRSPPGTLPLAGALCCAQLGAGLQRHMEADIAREFVKYGLESAGNSTLCATQIDRDAVGATGLLWVRRSTRFCMNQLRPRSEFVASAAMLRTLKSRMSHPCSVVAVGFDPRARRIAVRDWPAPNRVSRQGASSWIRRQATHCSICCARDGTLDPR